MTSEMKISCRKLLKIVILETVTSDCFVYTRSNFILSFQSLSISGIILWSTLIQCLMFVFKRLTSLIYFSWNLKKRSIRAFTLRCRISQSTLAFNISHEILHYNFRQTWFSPSLEFGYQKHQQLCFFFSLCPV